MKGYKGFDKNGKCLKVNGKIIKADTFYRLEDGKIAVLTDSGDKNE
ncbi:MAG: hypothetical protein E7C72_02005 [Dialister sp.]|nr:hypothetical protein [Dialister sp.]